MEKTVSEKLDELLMLMSDQDAKASTTVIYPEGVGHSSCEFERTAKGELKYKLKVYSNDIGGAVEAINKARELIPELEEIAVNGRKKENADSNSG